MKMGIPRQDRRSPHPFEGKLAGENPKRLIPASLQPDLSATRTGISRQNPTSKNGASRQVPKWDIGRIPQAPGTVKTGCPN